MTKIINKRCRNHQSREAVARCPECSRYFCRECVTEHDDRVLCTRCLRKLLKKKNRKSTRFISIVKLCQLTAGILLVWMIFFYIGQALLSAPSSFHEGTLWQQSWWDQP